MKFRPCIDLHNGRVKQIVGATLCDTDFSSLLTNFESDRPSSYYAGLYKRDSLKGGHVIMLGQGNERAAEEALAAFPGGFHVGGGITPQNAGRFLDAGASHVIVTSYVFSNGAILWNNLDTLVNAIGKQRLVLDLSCKRKDGLYYVVTDRWQRFTAVTIAGDTITKLSAYCDEFLVHAADVEGKKSGIDEELVKLLGEKAAIPVTYAGGIRSIADLDRIDQLANGAVDATIGSALDIFGGELSYEAVVAWHKSVALK